MAYIVKRPINLNGKRRLIGEILQDEEITQSVLIRTGRVQKVEVAIETAMNDPEVAEEEMHTTGDEAQTEVTEVAEEETNTVEEKTPVNETEAGQEEAPAPQPRKKSRKKAKTEDGGDA